MARPAAKPRKKTGGKTPGKGSAKTEPRSLTLGLRSSFEAQKAAGIGEERLLAYVAFACFAAFLAGLPAAIQDSAAEGVAGGAVGLVAGRFVAVVIFGPLFLYGLAAITHMIASRVFGGQGSFFDARFALFWALVLGVPLVVANALAAHLLMQGGQGHLALWLGLGVFLLWLWIWTSLLAIAEGFSRLATFGFVLLAAFCIFGLLRLSVG